MASREPRVWFPAIRAGSGADVFTRRIAQALNRHGIRAEITWLPHRAEYAPWTAKIPDPPAWANIAHVNTWLARRFIPKHLALLATVHHCVDDPALAPYKSPAQALYHRFWVKRLETNVIRQADRVVAVSRYTAEQARAVFGRTDIIIIPNGLDTTLFRPARRTSPHTPFRLLFVGNWSARKGADLLPRIMRRLGRDFELYFTAGLHSRKLPGNLPSHMIPLAPVPGAQEMAQLYKDCDALLFPTRLEGFGLAALEAQACGLPVIATRGSALPGVVEHGVTGILCPMDDVDAFADAARALAHDTALWRRMGDAARERAERLFSEDTVVTRYIDCYRSMLEGKTKVG